MWHTILTCGLVLYDSAVTTLRSRFFVQSVPMLPDPEHFLKMRNRIQKIYNADQELIVRESRKKYTDLEANKLSGHVADPVESRALFAGPSNNRLE